MDNKRTAKELIKIAKEITSVGNSMEVTPLRKEIIKAIKAGKIAYNQVENFQEVIENLKIKNEENRGDFSSKGDLEVDDEGLEKLLNKFNKVFWNFYSAVNELGKF